MEKTSSILHLTLSKNNQNTKQKRSFHIGEAEKDELILSNGKITQQVKTLGNQNETFITPERSWNSIKSDINFEKTPI